jgi:hypothetical protein
MFTLFDQLFLLSLHGEKCTILPGIDKKLRIGLVGAVLDELIVQGKLQVVRNSRLELLESTTTGDELLDEAIAFLQKVEKPRKAAYWIKNLGTRLYIGKKWMIGRLLNEGILTHGEETVSWTLPYEDFPNPKASAWYVQKNRLRELVLTQGEPGKCQLALLSILRASKLLRLVFTQDERKIARRWIYATLMDRAMKEPVAQFIQEIAVAIETLTEDL